MNQGLKYLIIIILSVTLGWFIGYLSNPEKPAEVKKVFVEKIKNEVVRDTVRITEPVYIEKDINDTMSFQDSLQIAKTDTSQFLPIDSIDQIIDSDIIKEKLLSTINIKVDWITNDSVDVSELLNKKANSFNSSMVIEFWQSPLNLTGYELNRNKLKLFGFNPEESISLQVEDDKSELILKTNSFVLRLPKTNQFKTVDL